MMLSVCCLVQNLALIKLNNHEMDLTTVSGLYSRTGDCQGEGHCSSILVQWYEDREE